MPLEKIVLSGGRFPLVKPPRVALKRPRSRSNLKVRPPTASLISCGSSWRIDTAFNSPSSATFCGDIVNAAGRVTLYYSAHDDVLPDAESPLLDGYPELGVYGPGYDACLYDKVVGVCCSMVVNKDNAEKYEKGLIHIAYFFIPETLNDIVQTLLGTALAKMTDRLPVAGTATGFMMKALSSDGAAARAAAASAGALPWAAAVGRA